MFSITPLQESDIADMYQAVKKSQAHLEELGWILQASWDRFYQHYRAIVDKKKLSIFAIRVDGNFAGAVEIADQIDHYAIGYWMGVDYRGQGIATEAIKSVLNQFNNKPVFADTLIDNPASFRVLERLGFVLEWTNDKSRFYRLTNDK
jgi:RimJ/RimL family protein N-acetyltransferase